MRIAAYENYYAVLETIETSRIEKGFWDAVERKEGLEEVTKEFLEIIPKECHAFVFETKAIVLWRSGDKEAAVASMKRAFGLHPLPLAVSFFLAKWNLALCQYSDAFIYADILLELESMRSDTAFVNDARGIKLFALKKTGREVEAEIVLDLLPIDFEMSIDGEIWNIDRLRLLNR